MTLSIVVHLVLFILIEVSIALGIWKAMARDDMTVARLEQRRPPPKPNDQKIPLVFVDVDPSQATEEAPDETKFYSARNSIASDADEDVESLQPKIEGPQDKVLQTQQKEPAPESPPESEPEPDPEPDEPQEAETNPSQAAAEAPDEPLEPGDLALADPDEPDEAEEKTAPKSRPRTLAAARAEQGLPEEPIEQEGGAERHALRPTFDAKATLFGSYDEAIIDAIRTRWYALLNQRDYVRNRSGKVVVEFRLNYDGRVTHMKVTENKVGELLSLICQRAILDPAPYAPWPSDLRRVVGKDYREVRFTFYYN